MKHFPPLFFAISLFLSCNNLSSPKPEDIVVRKTFDLFNYISSNTIDSIRLLYPDYSEKYMSILSDSIHISNVVLDENSKIITVELTNYYSENHIENNSVKRNIILTYCPNDSNKYVILKSVGLVDKDVLPEEATYSGYLKAKAKDSDYEIIKDLNILDSIKVEMKNQLIERAKSQVTLELWHWTGNRAKVYYRIFNRSDEEIGYVQFSASYTYEDWPSYTFHNTVSSRDIPAYTIRDVDFNDFEFEKARWDAGQFFRSVYVTKYHLNSYKITKISFPLLEVHPIDYTGNEYVDYIKRHRKNEKDNSVSASEGQQLTLNLEGQLGDSDDAVFTYDGKADEGKVTFTVNGQKNVRKLKMGSYDRTTNKLVIREYFVKGDYVGDFDGTWKDGVFQGVFTNTKGGKIDFKLRQPYIIRP